MDEKIMIESVDGRDMITLYNDRSILIQTDYGDRHMALGQFSEEALAELGRDCITEGTTAPIPFKTDAAFEDVQVGDRVRVTYKDEEPTEFTVDEADSTEFSGRRTMYFYRDAKPNYTIDILSRPGPALPTQKGSFVEVDGELYTRWASDTWYRLDDSTHYWLSEYEMGQKDWKPATVTWSTK